MPEIEVMQSADKRIWVPLGVAFAAISLVAWFNGQYISSDIKAANKLEITRVEHVFDLKMKDVENAISKLDDKIHVVEQNGAVTRRAQEAWIELFRARNMGKYPDLVVPDLPD